MPGPGPLPPTRAEQVGPVGTVVEVLATAAVVVFAPEVVAAVVGNPWAVVTAIADSYAGGSMLAGSAGAAVGSAALRYEANLTTKTVPSAGWSVGDDIYSLTRAGNSPSWSTVRARFWKNEAANPQYGTWTDEQLARMRSGRAPQRYNLDKGGLESMDLSHEPVPFRDGGTTVVPRWPQDHAAVDPFRRPGS